MAEDIFDKIDLLPEDVQDYIWSKELAEKNLRIFEKYSIPEDRRDDFFDIENRIFLKELSIESLPGVVYKNLDIIDDRILKSFLSDLDKNIFSPIAEYLGVKIVDNGKNHNLADKSIQKFGIKFSAEEKTRFAEVADSFLSGARTKMQFKNTLTKEKAKGGLEMEKNLAGEVAEFLASYSRLEPIVAKAKKDASRNEAMASIAEATPASPDVISGPPDVIASDSEAISSSIPRKGGIDLSAPTPALRSPQGEERVIPDVPSEAEGQYSGIQKKDGIDFSIEEKEAEGLRRKVERLKKISAKENGGTDDALKAININFPSQELNNRFRGIIDSRIRSVRTGIQTFDVLTSPVASGGMGMEKTEANKISLILNQYLDATNKDLYGSKMAELKKEDEDETLREDSRKKTKEDEMNKVLDSKFSKLTGKTAGSLLKISYPAPSDPIKSNVIASKSEAISSPAHPSVIASDLSREAPQSGTKWEARQSRDNIVFPQQKQKIPDPNSAEASLGGQVRNDDNFNITKKKSTGWLGKLFPIFQKTEPTLSVRSADTDVIASDLSREAPQSGTKWEARQSRGNVAIPSQKQKTSNSHSVPSITAPSTLYPNAPSSVRPVMDDINFTPKLLGPVEEISRMTIEDFRKLSADPQEGIRKIKDKLNLLREESYMKYTAGLDAWRRSPVFGEYLKVLKSALKEGGTDSALQKSRVLRKDEFDAIINNRMEG